MEVIGVCLECSNNLLAIGNKCVENYIEGCLMADKTGKHCLYCNDAEFYIYKSTCR